MSFQKSEKIDLLSSALAKAKANFKQIKKSGYNPHFKSNFSTYADIDDGTQDALLKEGLVVNHYPFSVDDRVGVSSVLSHSSGQWTSCDLAIRPSKGTPQDVGSIITYFKRYAKAAMLGVEGEIDDDANSVSLPQKETYQSQNVGTKATKTSTFDPKNPTHTKWLEALLRSKNIPESNWMDISEALYGRPPQDIEIILKS